MPPLALVRTVADRQLVVGVCTAARAAGVRPGLSLAQARALCPHLAHAEHDAARDAKALEALARWMTRFTPSVQVADLPHGLFLDVTGTQRLFGPLEQLVDRMASALTSMKVGARLAIAPTPGAAWALTYAPDRGAGSVPPPGAPTPIGGTNPTPRASPVVTTLAALPAALDGLPPVALRLDDAALATLHHLGLHAVGQVLRLPRDLLPARFGPDLLRRIDQALGTLAEPLTPLPFHAPVDAAVDFDGVVDSLESLWMHFNELIARIVAQLTRLGLGVRRLAVTFARPYAPAIDKTIDLSAPSRDPAVLFNLVRCAMETIGEGKATKRRRHGATKGKAAHVFTLRRPVASPVRRYEHFTPAGFTGLRLTASVCERLTDEQVSLLGQAEAAGRHDLDRLVERLRIRLGDDALIAVRPVESYVPERAYSAGGRVRGSEVGVQESGNAHSRVRRPKSLAVSRNGMPGQPTLLPDPRPPTPEPPPRPLHLLPMPREIPVIVRPSHDRDGAPVAFTHAGRQRTIVHAVGPERIGGAWWLGHDKTRDYFDVEDGTGRRWWVFRVAQTSRWYLHGRFE